MELKLHREVAGGSIDYYEAPAGWLTIAGTVRTRPYRKYLWTPDDGEPVKLPSVSSICDQVCPKDGVPYWSEARGVEGAVLAFRAGLLSAASCADHAIAVVREHGLGAEAAKNRAAKRGLNVHAINQHYMMTGEVPRLSDHPREHHGYIRAWGRWALARNPEPVEVETPVVHPEDGYAGRLDLRAQIGGLLTTIGFKTQERAGIYTGAHLQECLYERAAIRDGAEPAGGLLVVALAADGQWAEMAAGHDDSFAEAALSWWRAKRPVDSACQSHNRTQKQVRA